MKLPAAYDEAQHIPKAVFSSDATTRPRSSISGYTDYKYTPVITSTLLWLPADILDQIYNHAFGHGARIFRQDNYLVTASPSNLPAKEAADFPKDPKSIEGLPRWLLACKQICTEAMSVFSRTRSFDGGNPCCGKAPPPASEDPSESENPPRHLHELWEQSRVHREAYEVLKVKSAEPALSNSLVFNGHVVRTIRIYATREISLTGFFSAADNWKWSS
ncbi:hypothetical protein CC86DRAFT_14700 [Ophiobolus disseminans]|uniref:Uncharacterized protein n=1 Tax=Ophiobolus disseminans TaxID=1469910 RepID=A0A6A7AKF0_9PLEO|nr:hypothetical protein CC86DRAFT_14700 [Ophiobolus disseminans]